MILSDQGIRYFHSLQSRILQALTGAQSKVPYVIPNEPFINQYECLRLVWAQRRSIKEACNTYKITRSSYYQIERRFIQFGLPGILSFPYVAKQDNDLEDLVLLVKKSRPALSYTAIHRIAQALPLTKENTSPKLVSKILQSHGHGISNMKSDPDFWARIQRRIKTWLKLSQKPIEGRDPKKRGDSFFSDRDDSHKRLELLRAQHLEPKTNTKQACMQFGISTATFYRLVSDYKLLGPWAVIPAFSDGKEGVSRDLQLSIILEKLKHPDWSPGTIVKNLGLKISRFAVHRVICRWGLENKERAPIAVDEFLDKGTHPSAESSFKPVKSAFHQLSEKTILSTRRMNHHFEKICHKMKIRPFNICDPGPLLLAPFVNDLGVVQAFEVHGPQRLRGKEITNLALLNIFRILSGYRRISHLSNNRDRAVALASGLGMYGSTSKYYEDTIEFTFDQLHRLRLDLVARAKELRIIEGMKIGFDFHFKKFFGSGSKEKNIGKGPDKAGDLVPGFRPHIAWDLAANVIISIAYFQGAARAPRIYKQFCEQNIYTIIDPKAIKEIYMDSEYTKEQLFYYFKEETCPNSNLYICLRKNKQIKNFIQPGLEESEGWSSHEKNDEIKAIEVELPKTRLRMKIVIMRDKETKEKIRCFGSTNLSLSKEEIIERYRYRWIIENGIKDLVTSYFIDEVYGMDPQKIEFEFYCVMVARLAYESFLKKLGGKYLNNESGNKCTLQRMRNLLLEKRNCTIHQDKNGNFVLTNLDSATNDKLLNDVSRVLIDLHAKSKNKVLWWNERAIFLQTGGQYEFLKGVQK